MSKQEFLKLLNNKPTRDLIAIIGQKTENVSVTVVISQKQNGFVFKKSANARKQSKNK